MSALPVGTLVMLTHGEYSDFTVEGFVQLLGPLSLVKERELYVREFYRGKGQGFDYDAPEFRKWLEDGGKVKPCVYEEFHVYNYTFDLQPRFQRGKS